MAAAERLLSALRVWSGCWSCRVWSPSRASQLALVGDRMQGKNGPLVWVSLAAFRVVWEYSETGISWGGVARRGSRRFRFCIWKEPNAAVAARKCGGPFLMLGGSRFASYSLRDGAFPLLGMPLSNLSRSYCWDFFFFLLLFQPSLLHFINSSFLLGGDPMLL